MVLDFTKKKLSPADDSFTGIRVGVLTIIGFALFAILAFRLWSLQILTGDQYAAAAQDNRIREVKIEAPRGVIYDRNGRILVQNRAGLSVGLLPMDMYDPKKNPAEFQREISGLARILGASEAELLAAYEKAKKNPYFTTVIRKAVPENPVVATIKEHSLEYLGVQVEASFLRDYPFKALATHLLGYVGEASENDLDQEQFATLRPGANLGKNGVERTFDSFLRGTDGYKTVEVDAAGRPKRFLEEVPPTPGSSLVLTIDSDLQAAAEDALSRGIEAAHASGYPDAAGGAVVALDPRTGEVLALASYPDYDPSEWSGGISRTKYAELTAQQAHYPLLNRAIAGLYPAGSTFKPFVAATALNAGLITPATTFFSPGKFSVAGHTWKDWNPTPLGDVDVVQALEQSVDVFFYNLGYQLYQQEGPVLQDGLRQFGFGKKTGIDLPSESDGRVPDKFWKSSVGRTVEDRAWRPGDEINLAIGQGDLLATPLQLAVAFSAVANGGDVVIPHLGHKLTDSSGNTVHSFDNQVAGRVEMSSSTLGAIRKGLRKVVSDPSGTAYEVFRGFPIAVAGKTGSAQMLPGDAAAWFEGYAPSDDPQIVVVALVERGGHGSAVAAPIVREVMAEFFNTGSGSTSVVKATE